MRTTAYFGFFGLIVMGLWATSAAADANLKRLTTTGTDPRSTCEALSKRALTGYETNPGAVRYGTCTCSPNAVKGSSGAYECVLYYTTN
jgi:hypothetical protein